MLRDAVWVLSCLLLASVSSAPLSSDSHSSSSSDEDLQPPAVFPVVGGASPQTPPSVIVEVEDTKTNIALSFAIFIISEEEEEGSGTDGRGRSEDNSSSSESDDISDEVSSEDAKKQDSQPMKKEYDDHMIITDKENVSSEEMMSDQPMLPFSDEEADGFNNSTFTENNWNQKQTLSEYFDYVLNTSTESNVSHKLRAFHGLDAFIREVFSQPAGTAADYVPNNANTKETVDPTSPRSDDSDDFNNSTESTEMNNQLARTILDYFHDNNTSSDEATLSLSNDFSNALSSEVTELNRNPQVIPFTPDNQRVSSSRQEMFGTSTVDKLVLDPVSQEVTISSSEKTRSVHQDRMRSGRGSISKDFGFGSRLQELFHSIQEVLDLLSDNKGVMETKRTHRKVLGSIPNSLTGSQKGFSLSSDESSEMFSKFSSDPKNQAGVSSDPDIDESMEATTSIQLGTGSRDSTQQVTGPKTSLICDLISPGPCRKEVQDTSAMSIQEDNAAGLNPVGLDQNVAPVSRMLKDAMSQINSKESAMSLPHGHVSLKSDSSEESQEPAGTWVVVGLELSKVRSPEVSSSSEDVLLDFASSSSPLLVSSPVPSTQTSPESTSFSSESQESDSSVSKSDSAGLDSGNNSQSTELHPNPIPTSDSSLSPESNYNPSFDITFRSISEISQGESEELPTVMVPTEANSDTTGRANPTVDYRTNTDSIAASSEDSMDTKLDSGVKDAEADLRLEATTDSSNNLSIYADPTTATAHSTSLPSLHVNTDAGSELSVEDDDEASTESGVSMKPTATTEYRTNPPDSRASMVTITNPEREQAGADVSTEANPNANSPGSNQYANSEESMASPLPPPPVRPRTKRPYRFGFLGPISHSYANRPVSEERASSSPSHARETLAVLHRHSQNVYSNPLRDFFRSQYNADREHRQKIVSGQSSRKQMSVSLAAVANPAQTSSEENNQDVL